MFIKLYSNHPLTIKIPNTKLNLVIETMKNCNGTNKFTLSPVKILTESRISFIQILLSFKIIYNHDRVARYVERPVPKLYNISSSFRALLSFKIVYKHGSNTNIIKTFGS